MVFSTVRRSPPREPLENGTPGDFHVWESLEYQIHCMFLLIAFSSSSGTEMGDRFFAFICCFFNALLGSLENQCDWYEIFIGCLEY